MAGFLSQNVPCETAERSSKLLPLTMLDGIHSKAPVMALAALTVIVAASVVYQEATGARQKIATGPQPQLEIDTTIRDLGKTSPGYPVSSQYVFKNTGAGPLIFGKITASCGCTVAELPKMQYSPGEKGVLLVNVNAREGRKQMYVYLQTNDPNNEMITLPLQVEGIKDIVLEPAEFDFNGLKLGEEVTREVTVKAGDGRRFKLENAKWNHIEGTRGGIKMKPVEPDSEGRARQWVVTIKLKPDEYIADKDMYRITFKSDIPRMNNFTIPLRLKVRHPVQEQPGTRHFLGVARPGEKTATEILLTTDDGAPFKIVALETAEANGLNLELSHMPTNDSARQQVTIKAHVPGDAVQGFLSARLRISTDREGTPDLEPCFSVHVLAP